MVLNANKDTAWYSMLPGNKHNCVILNANKDNCVVLDANKHYHVVLNANKHNCVILNANKDNCVVPRNLSRVVQTRDVDANYRAVGEFAYYYYLCGRALL